MFSGAKAFNQPLNSWNTGNVTTMGSMFANATAFNQNIGLWNITKVDTFTSFMLNKTSANYLATNYNSLLNGWASQNVLTGRSITFGSIKYTAAGQAGRNILTATKGWTITDGGITT